MGRGFWEKKDLFKGTGMLSWRKEGKFFCPFGEQLQVPLVEKILNCFAAPKRDKETPYYQGRKKLTLGTDQGKAIDMALSGKSLCIQATAGSGKSTWVSEFCHETRGSVLNLTFSRESKNDLIKKIPTDGNCVVQNFHGLALSFMSRILGGKISIDIGGSKYYKFFKDNPYESSEKIKRVVNEIACRNLAGMVMNSLTDYNDNKAMMALAGHYVNNLCFFMFAKFLDWDWMIETTQKLMVFLEKDAFKNKGVTFDEMLYYFAKSNIDCPNYDTVIVDECQDTNPCQVAMIRKFVKKQIIAVGDKKQAIYGFRGADHMAVENLVKTFHLTEMPLMETRRVPQVIVDRLNKKFNIDMKTAKPGGEIFEANGIDPTQYKAKDMLLARRRVDVLNGCLELNCANVPAAMIGDDLASMLLGALRHTKSYKDVDGKVVSGTTCPETIANRLGSGDPDNPDDDKITLTKRVLSRSKDLNEFIEKSAAICSLDETKVSCGTCHSAKGLESETVHLFIGPDGFSPNMPMQEWEKQSEVNLRFVAESRALNKLNIISVSEG